MENVSQIASRVMARLAGDLPIEYRIIYIPTQGIAVVTSCSTGLSNFAR